MVIAVTGSSIVAAIALQAAPVGAGAPIDLFCVGRGDRFVTTQTKIRNQDGSVTNRSENRRVPFDDAVRVKVAAGTGQALIPDAMLDADEARGWHDIKGLSVTPGAITGKVYFDWLFSPVMTLNRATNTLRITGSLANFSGACSRYDPRTSRVPARAPVSAASRYAPATTPPPGGDPRAAARAMAQQTDSRAAVRSAALKADLAFRLFNAGTSPIVSLVMIGTNRVPSKTWLRPGETVAPRAFRAMSFATGRQCRHDVRISFADRSEITRPIDFCGKDVLYASARDLFAE